MTSAIHPSKKRNSVGDADRYKLRALVAEKLNLSDAGGNEEGVSEANILAVYFSASENTGDTHKRVIGGKNACF